MSETAIVIPCNLELSDSALLRSAVNKLVDAAINDGYDEDEFFECAFLDSRGHITNRNVIRIVKSYFRLTTGTRRQLVVTDVEPFRRQLHLKLKDLIDDIKD